jgi:ATP-binding cassette, subfamily C (CFTR/MRP), member 1
MGELVAAQSPLMVPDGSLWDFTFLSSKAEPFCSNAEGWGPISLIRYDFTPCFLDIWLLFVAAWGVFCGAAAIWYLLRRRTAAEVPQNWHFYTKL